MKTPMQQLIEWVDSYENYPVKPTAQNVKEKCWQLLEEEKRQIIVAWEDIDIDNLGIITGEQYYNQTYNNENKQDTVQ